MTERRVAFGVVEVVYHPRQPGTPLSYVDLLFPQGSLLGVTYRRDPQVAVARVAMVRGTRLATCWVLVNSRALFVGVGRENIVEVGVGRVGFALHWTRTDLRRVARGHKPLYRRSA